MRTPALLVLLFALAPVWAEHADQERLAADLNETVVRVPADAVLLDGSTITRDIVLTVYHPAGAGKFPLVVLNHGRDSRWQARAKTRRYRMTWLARRLVRSGFSVIVPTRIGYGDTGTNLDPEDMDCSRGVITPSLQSAGNAILTSINYARTLPHVDPLRIVVLGVSWGGIASVAAGATNPPGVVGIVNVSGGMGGRQHNNGVPCAFKTINTAFAALGAVSKVPNLWVYSENDQYFGPRFVRNWADSFADAGGTLEFKMLPPFESDGHNIFGRGFHTWSPLVAAFLKRTTGVELR